MRIHSVSVPILVYLHAFKDFRVSLRAVSPSKILFYVERFVYSQMVLPFEGFRAELTHVFSLVTVCELMLCQSA